MNKLVDKYNNTYYYSIAKETIDAGYSSLTEETESIHRNPKTKVDDRVIDRVRITKHKNIFSNVYTKNWSKEIFVIDSMLKTNP